MIYFLGQYMVIMFEFYDLRVDEEVEIIIGGSQRQGSLVLFSLWLVLLFFCRDVF